MISTAIPCPVVAQMREQFARMPSVSDAVFYCLFRYGASEQAYSILKEQFPNSELLDAVAETFQNPNHQ